MESLWMELPIIYFSSIVLLYITLYREVRNFWHAVFVKITGLSKLAEWLLPKKYAKYFKVMRNRYATCITIIDTMYHNNRHNYTAYTH
jgi:hypothetical protein